MSNPFEEPETTEVKARLISNRENIKMTSMTKHKFQWHNYKRPTFCKHCGNLLVGMLKQGMRCKRCDVDVHDKCQEDLRHPCISMIVGQHNFREKTYKQPTYCDYCKKLLVGLVNQGLKCSECGTNVHEKCQNKIEATCEETKRKPPEIRSTKKDKQRESSKVTKSKSDDTKTSNATAETPKTEYIEDATSLFAPMPKAKRGSAQLDAPITPVLGSPKVSPRTSRSPSFASTSAGAQGAESSSKIDQTNQLVGEVVDIMKNNFEKMNDRHEKLDNLEDNADKLREKANLFQTNAKEIKKKMWMKNYKMWIIIIVVALLIVGIIVASVLLQKKK